jgi:hypothetical protein
MHLYWLHNQMVLYIVLLCETREKFCYVDDMHRNPLTISGMVIYTTCCNIQEICICPNIVPVFRTIATTNKI